MIWISTAVYFLVCSIILIWGFVLYGRCLMFFGKCSFSLRNMGGLFVYVIFSLILTSPIFLSSMFIDNVIEKINLNTNYMIYYISLFLISEVPGWLYFKKYYLNDLKKLGYFK